MTKARKTHWQQLEVEGALCGEQNRPQLTHDQEAVTCGRCRRLLGIAPYRAPLPAGYRQTKTKGDALDSLMRQAFGDYEAGLRNRVEAVKLAIQATSPDAYEGGEAEMRACMSQLLIDVCKEAKALVDYLEGRPNEWLNS